MMRIGSWVSAASLAILSIFLPGCAGSGGGGPSVTPHFMDAQADAELRRMSTYLAGLSSFSVEADIEYDDYLVDNQKVQLSNRISMDVSRPGRLRGEVAGDQDNKRFWFENGRVTVLDQSQNHYSELETPATIDGMLDSLGEDHRLRMPLAELVSSDPFAKLMDKVTCSHYAGLRQVNGRDCHHLAFEQPSLSWQVWIDAGDHPFPRRLLVSYTSLPNCPQYEATFVDWESAPTLSDASFKPQIPEGAGKIESRTGANKTDAGSSGHK